MSLRRSMLFSLGGMINPIDLGQPKVWLTGEPSYLTNSVGATPTDGNLLNVFKRYNDNGFNPTNTSTVNRAVYRVLSGKNYIGWEGLTTTLDGRYAVGTTTDLNFMHKLNSGFTVYWVFKNLQNENHTTKVIGSTSGSTNDIGFIHAVTNVGNDRYFLMRIDTGAAGFSAINLGSNYFYDSTVDVPVMLMSWRVDLSVSVGNPGAWVYRNGVLDNTSNILNTPSSSNTSSNILSIGNRGINGLRMTGYVGDYIIFNGVHSESTHNAVCNFLKNKWGIA